MILGWRGGGGVEPTSEGDLAADEFQKSGRKGCKGEQSISK